MPRTKRTSPGSPKKETLLDHALWSWCVKKLGLMIDFTSEDRAVVSFPDANPPLEMPLAAFLELVKESGKGTNAHEILRAKLLEWPARRRAAA
jgi:hypothetical protein